MKEGIVGGLMMGGLVGMAVIGFMPGLCLFLIGILFGSIGAMHERREEQRANNWRKNYPSYKY